MTQVAAPLDLVTLSQRATQAAQQWRPGCQIVDIVELQGGRSSLTYRAVAAPSTDLVVLKVAPPGLAPVRNRDVLRQARIIDALGGVADMRVPDILFDDAADPPFFAMSHVAGTSFEPHLTAEPDAASDDDITGRALHAARLLAVLHGQHADRLGAAAEPVITLDDEIGRWERAFDTVADLDRDLWTSAVVGLRADVPQGVADRLLHGDFRLGNMLSEGGAVNAIIDWEIWSRGDPRTDLAWFVLCCDAPAYPTAVRHHPAVPAVEVLLDEYLRHGGCSIDRLGWFRALALTKMAATTALISKHDRRSGRVQLADHTLQTVTPMLEGALCAL